MRIVWVHAQTRDRKYSVNIMGFDVLLVIMTPTCNSSVSMCKISEQELATSLHTLKTKQILSMKFLSGGTYALL